LNFKLINREISWLLFNERVLQEAADSRTPLIERMKFLGIFSNNQDEFFKVRVATINRLAILKKKNPNQHFGFNPNKILKDINRRVVEQGVKFNEIYRDILLNLEKENIFIVNEKDLSPEHGQFVLNYFHEEVRPNIFPVMVKNISEPFFLKDNYLYLIIELMGKSYDPITDSPAHQPANSNDPPPDSKPNYAIIEVPTPILPRFVILPQKENRKYIMILEDVIRYCLSDIFGLLGYKSYNAYTIKITRDTEIDLDSDVSKSFMELMTASIKQRKLGRPVRLIYDSSIPQYLLRLLSEKFKIKKTDTIIKGERYHNFKDFMNFPEVGLKKFKYESITPLIHKDLPLGKSIINTIRQKDILLHYPYNSFNYMIDLLREASIDPKVRSIRMILYRVARNSNVINALINAARNGKSVTVFMEFQARFDEEANIRWAEKLQEEGVKILNTIPGLKVHCKLLLIKRLEQKKVVSYANIATGNYNEDTARTFSDLSLLTSDKRITSEVENVFSMCEATYKPYKFRNLLVSPLSMRKHIIRMLGNEIKNARAGKEAYAIIKLNSLVDESVIRKLYQASNEGVLIRLIVRGICTLTTGIEGLSENIEGVSIVDRYLEHARVMIFCNGGEEKYYISSADWMTRNIDHRIEVACPIYDKEIQGYLKDMLLLQLSDNVKARIISDGINNEYKSSPQSNVHSPQDKRETVRSQTDLYKVYRQHFC
jgi:polyphosphate kinase